MQHETNTQAPEKIVRAAQAPQNKRRGAPAFWAANKRNAKDTNHHRVPLALELLDELSASAVDEHALK